MLLPLYSHSPAHYYTLTLSQNPTIVPSSFIHSSQSEPNETNKERTFGIW